MALRIELLNTIVEPAQLFAVKHGYGRLIIALIVGIFRVRRLVQQRNFRGNVRIFPAVQYRLLHVPDNLQFHAEYKLAVLISVKQKFQIVETFYAYMMKSCSSPPLSSHG